MDEPESLHVGVVGGTRLPGNVRAFLRNFRGLLEAHPVDFNFDIVIRRGAADELNGYNVVDPGLSTTSRAVWTLKTLTNTVTRYADSANPDVLFQVTKFPIHGFATSIAGQRTGTAVVTRLAGDNFNEHRYSDGLVDQLQTFTINNVVGSIPVRLSDMIITLGPHGRREIKRRIGQPSVREIPQPVNLDQFTPVLDNERSAAREKLGMTGDGRVVLTVGRLTSRKGMHDVASTARFLARKDANVRWYVVGEGPLRELLEATPIVEPVGHVPHEQMSDYYKAADLLVHPSLIEGLPNVLLEAAACGLPSISRKVGESSTVASTTYEDPSNLHKLILQEHQAVELGRRFDPSVLREKYAEVLLAAGGLKEI